MMHVTFLDHSGFLVELPGLTLLFDWWKGDLPPLPSGPLLVFASHRHPDHFDPRIFALDDGQRDVRFLLGKGIHLTAEGRTVFHAGDLNWWHWEGEDPVWNRNMEADFRRYAEPLRGRKIDLAMLPLDPRLGEDGFRGPQYFLELADIRRFLPMHQWGNFNFTNQFLSCYTSFTSRTVYVNRVGQVFTFEEEADT